MTAMAASDDAAIARTAALFDAPAPVLEPIARDLTRQMAREYARNGIRVNCIAPGTVETPMNIKVLERVPNPAELRRAWERMHPMGRIGQPLDIAWGALYLACDESSWVTGQCLSIDGGVSAKFPFTMENV